MSGHRRTKRERARSADDPGPNQVRPRLCCGRWRRRHSPTSALEFIAIFGQALARTFRRVFLSDDGQPFVLAGSGTLALEVAVANLVEPGDDVLVVNTGYFSDRLGAMASRHGAAVHQVTCEVGDAPSADAVATALRERHYKLMTITHVDTSTGVRADVAPLAHLAAERATLTVVDGVCAIGGEEFRQSAWGVTFALRPRRRPSGCRRAWRWASSARARWMR